MATYSLISSITVSSATSSITFTSIPQTFTDLCVVLSVRSSRAFTNDSVALEVNSSTSDRSGRVLFGDSNTAQTTTTTSEVAFAAMTGANATSSIFSGISIYCPNYTLSSSKSFSIEGVTENNSGATESAFQSLNGWLWSNSAAITSLTFKSSTGNNFVQYSTAHLYGISNA